MSLLIVGCGYVGRELVRHVHQDVSYSGQAIYALTRTKQRAAELESWGVYPLVGDWLIEDSLPKLPDIQRIVVSVPHRAVDDGDAKQASEDTQVHVRGLCHIRQWLRRSGMDELHVPLVYLSTTGVYGSTDSGQIIDEHWPVSPTRIGPKMAVAAEQWLLDHQSDWPSTTLRLAGIYGPGRIPLLRSLQDGLPIAVSRTGYLNLVHVTDAARAILWAMKHPGKNSVLLVADGQPVLREEFYRYLAQLCGTPEPKFTEPDPNSNKALRATDKRIDSSLFWRLSGLSPVYPNYQAGLSAIAKAMAAQS